MPKQVYHKFKTLFTRQFKLNRNLVCKTHRDKKPDLTNFNTRFT